MDDGLPPFDVTHTLYPRASAFATVNSSSAGNPVV